MNGKPYSCYLEDDCSLNLQMYSHNTNGLAPPYSQESALGIVMANGNTGKKLSTGSRNAKTSTFISRDGGLNWNEVA